MRVRLKASSEGSAEERGSWGADPGPGARLYSRWTRPPGGRNFNRTAGGERRASIGDTQARRHPDGGPAGGPSGPVLRWAARLAAALVLAATAAAQESLPALQRTVRAWKEAPSGWDGLRTDRAGRFAGDLDAALATYGDQPAAWRLALETATLDRRGATGEGIAIAGRAGREGFRRLLAGPASATVRRWALGEVVVGVDRAPDGRSSSRRGWTPDLIERRACLELLLPTKTPGLRTALLTVARRGSDPLRPDAFKVLARWADVHGRDDAIDLFLVQQLGSKFDVRTRPHPVNVVLDRLNSSSTPLSDRAQGLLRERIEAMLLKTDWREPARALRLARGIPVEERVPILLDALSVWDRRAKSKKEFAGLVRVQNDLVRELRDISGRRHGPQPAPWIDWWVRVRQGKEPMPGSPEFERAKRDREAEPRSTASFFGIRPESDRVTFVIDFSGSMANGYGTTEHSRYVEAIEQMMRFLQGAPPSTEFNVMLFSGTPLLSSPELVPATPENLQLARRSLLARQPNGGTNLEPAIELALKIGPNGEPDVEELEADTIIVLCDGETSEGPRWVAPMLDRVLPIHPVVFHTVLLGVNDDGTLRALADESGGRFLRVGG